MSNQKKYHWTSDKDDFLKENYKNMTAKEIGDKLGFPYYIINNRKKALGLIVKRGPLEYKDKTLDSLFYGMAKSVVALMRVRKRNRELIEIQRKRKREAKK